MDHVGLWTPQDDKVLKPKSLAPLNLPLPRLYVCIDDEQWHQNSEQVAFPLFPLPLTAERSNSQRIMSIVPLNSTAEFMFLFIQYMVPSGFSSMDKWSQIKTTRSTEVLLSMTVLCGVFCISALPIFVFISIEITW